MEEEGRGEVQTVNNKRNSKLHSDPVQTGFNRNTLVICSDAISSHSEYMIKTLQDTIPMGNHRGERIA